MKKIDDGGPAYPRSASVYGSGNSKSPDDWREEQDGMSLRDYFAGQIIPVLLTLSVKRNVAWSECVEDAFSIADRMIEQRSKPIEP